MPAKKYTASIGAVFGRLTVISKPIPVLYVVCRCECGKTRRVRVNSLYAPGRPTKSCGCLHRDTVVKAATTHGMSHTREYQTYDSMMRRCYKKKHPGYADYGGRGIKVCDRWRGSFENFYADMGLRPAGASLDRYPNNDGDYEPGNCRWATDDQQSNNKRSTRFLTHDGLTLTAMQWARKIGISYSGLHKRLKLGWSVEKALTEPVSRFS